MEKSVNLLTEYSEMFADLQLQTFVCINPPKYWDIEVWKFHEFVGRQGERQIAVVIKADPACMRDIAKWGYMCTRVAGWSYYKEGVQGREDCTLIGILVNREVSASAPEQHSGKH